MSSPHITHNHVLIVPECNFTTMGDLLLNDDFDPQYHVSVLGRVAVVPQRLQYFGYEIAELKRQQAGVRIKDSAIQRQVQFMNKHSTLFDTEMELQVGDKVVFPYNYHEANDKSGGMIDIGAERPAMLIPYSDLVMAIRGEERIMLNGFVWVEPIEYTQAEMNAMASGLFNELEDKRKPMYGKVVEIGSQNRAYLNYPEMIDDDITVGQTVLYRNKAGVAVEWWYHKQLHQGKYPALRLQRKDILAVMP